MNERAPTTFVCVGPSSIAILGTGALGLAAMGWFLTPLFFAGSAVSAIMVYLAGSATIVVSDTSVDVSLAARFMRASIPLASIESCDATRYHGWSRGYRAGRDTRRWVVRGGPAVAIVAQGVRYVASADFPESVCEEIRRRLALTMPG